MNALLNKIKRTARQIKGLFPQALPVGMTAFDSLADFLLDTYTLPTTDRDSIKFAVATVIMHLGPQGDRKSPYFFVRTIRAGCAKQIAAANFQEIKLRQQEAARKAAEQPVAVPTSSEQNVTSIG